MTAQPGPGHLPLAVDRHGQLHDARAIDDSPGALVPPLRCADCGATLEAVRAHPRRDHDTIVHVAAYYRLTPGATHATSCPWRSQQESPAPAARPGGRPAAAPLRYALVVPGRGGTPRPVWRSRSSQRKWLPALNSAAQVADLVAHHGSGAGAIILDYRGRPIRWQDFVYTGVDADRLSQLLHQGRLRHPIAVMGRLGDLQVARSGRTHVAALSDPSAPDALHPGGTRLLLRTANRQLLDCDPARLVVALGWWQPHSRSRPAGLPPVHDVVLWINRGWQVSHCPK